MDVYGVTLSIFLVVIAEHQGIRNTPLLDEVASNVFREVVSEVVSKSFPKSFLKSSPASQIAVVLQLE